MTIRILRAAVPIGLLIATATGVLFLGWARQVKTETLAVRYSGDTLDYASSSSALRSLQQKNHDALVELANAVSFVDRDSGCWWCTPDGTPVYVRAFEDVASDPGALLAFQELALTATPAGRIYGLCGLYYADSAAFPGTQARLNQTSETVLVSESYDVLREASVAVLASKPEITCRALAPNEELLYLLFLWQGRAWQSGEL